MQLCRRTFFVVRTEILLPEDNASSESRAGPFLRFVQKC